MNKKKTLLIILLFIIVICLFIVPKTISKYRQQLRRTVMLDIVDGPLPYFKNYNGTNDLFGLDKTDITSFSRNTTLTKSQVLEKSGVELISNTEDDGYTSTDEIYGWIEDNKFYWWSEAETVYFHPNTTNAFREFTSIVTIDLTNVNTSKVQNFSYWFYDDKVLTDIYGKINTKGINDLKPSYGTLNGMFNNCRKLKSIDVSEFDTSNVNSMVGTFNCCMALTSLDLSTFDTSNVVSMIDMFATCNNLKYLNVSSFDTSKVTGMGYMFYWMTALEVLDIRNFDTRSLQSLDNTFSHSGFEYIYLGENFDTSKVINMNTTFGANNKLKAIYVKHDFVINPKNTSTSTFGNDSLVGGYESEYEFPFDNSKRGPEYAKISNENQEGYFTYLDNTEYNITYDLGGGTLTDPKTKYFPSAPDTIINNPTKAGNIFVGWTGDNGNEPNVSVVIPHGSTGDRHYVANYVETNNYQIEGPCTFRGGTSNILGDNCKITSTIGNTIHFTNSTYINTGIMLFDSENIDKDFEISFTIDSVDSYTSQATLLSSMNELAKPWPGFVFRIDNSSRYQLRGGYNQNSNWFIPTTTQNIRIVRQNKILKYSVDGGNLTQTVNFNNPLDPFDYPVTIGSGLDEQKAPRRFFSGTISNISISIGS